jgi:hypothetical protein
MIESSSGAQGPLHRSVEIGVAIAILLFGGIIILGAVKAGIGWGPEGPRAGFFPFYVGIATLIAGTINLVRARREGEAGLFAEWGQLRQVVSVIIPTAVYVALVPWLGFYVASFLLIAVFMRWLGAYGWGMVAAVSVGVPVAAFLMFEKWFLVPLPKGPLEDLLGL